MSEPIINRVAESAIISLDLEEIAGGTKEWVSFDLKPYLFMELILKEKDYREQLKNTDWSVYTGKRVAVYCSADAIIPVWAYMLAASYLQPIVQQVFFGTVSDARDAFLLRQIDNLELDKYRDQRIVIKGCGEEPVKESAYLAITAKLRPVAKSIMYGEPCSTVPIYKRPKV
jgi:hypothetical protein